ncbi:MULTISPECIES: MerR family transcriptional regulator [Clostridium]|uniref:Putative transcriptional regulator, MerR family n=1 Tax=Clostridium saccharoperbutylacetonicum N1-4(HMT) TaxID=931276 RepID=M1MM21_9CLOT|nr:MULTISPECIES: MerR family transcriptional regulator [Clostridium]AGF55806.1 putative transcriptional regulator, MerR family [Clostridium saccharoperbutylacetonicum N1-4(HMT)]AQR94535.1 HTH-type transcriptional regulator AdhR [Clostridium saccharoperbutylacetonicum]NRT63460.1 DNA-binding transcriptional MerR regulator [Clostridium saccharoperbutylacetonicum]NSB26822.1 DNA-binding transcriptional MerR regulator [Clostridium saccharoperbutylacetonicum]NSB30370.1 DNA-binding transcriptional Mer
MNLSIKEVAEKFNITPYTLRYYEREGLIPSVQRKDNGRRVYTDVDLGWLQIVSCMKATGMSISYIKNYVELCTNGKDTLEERRKIMCKQKEIINEEIKKYTDLLELVDMKLDYYDEKISKDELKKIITEKKK